MSNPGHETRVPALRLDPELGLIFDMDGVIVDSMPLHTLAWQRYLVNLGIAGDDVEQRMHGRRNDEIVRDFLGAGVDPRVVFEHGAAKERLFREMMRPQLAGQLVARAFDFLNRISTTRAARAPTAAPPN